MKKVVLAAALLFSGIGVQAQNSNFKMDSINNRIPANAVQDQSSAEALQKSLYELIDQKHAVHQAHWNVRGPQFISLHELLGDLYGELGGYIDEVAERKLALGKPADGRPSQAASNANLGSVSADFVSDHEAIQQLTARYKKLSDRLGERIESTGKTDPVTQDLLIAVRNSIDLHLWKLRSFNYSK